MQEAPALAPVALSAGSGILSAVIAGLLTAAVKGRELNAQLENKKQEIAAQHEQQALAERERLRETVLRQVVRPLEEAATDLRQRLIDVHERAALGDPFVLKSFEEMKLRSERQVEIEAFLASCAGGWHHYAGTTLYRTAVYLACASRMRDPSRPAVAGLDEAEAAVEQVRHALGGEYGIWSESQDSIGAHMLDPNGRVMTFREFLTRLVDQSEHKWYLRLLDAFYKLDAPATRAMLTRAIGSLTDLQSALGGGR